MSKYAFSQERCDLIRALKDEFGLEGTFTVRDVKAKGIPMRSYSAIRELKNSGLLTVVERRARDIHRYKLTPTGKKIALYGGVTKVPKGVMII